MSHVMTHTKPQTPFQWTCYNAACRRVMTYGGMAWHEVCEYIAGRHGAGIDDTKREVARWMND